MAHISPAGPTQILNLTSTTTGPGTAYQVHPRSENLTFFTSITGTSAGVTVTGTANIDVSNDGSNWVGAVGTTMVISGVTPQGAIGRIASSLDGHWEYIRANLTAASSTTTASTGYNVVVTVSAKH